ncbi:MAG: T9SS type A sorting domain-containing protein [Bacteroidales bacterium]|nr:T9SS type A sorting domain-containing protein [Bacteroidales bacterium]
MMRFRTIPFLFWLLLGAAFSASAQDTLTVMQYNLLYYGNYNTSYYSCFETNNNTQRKDECIRTIMGYVKPDIFTVNEFGATDALLENFISHNLNTGSINYWRSDSRINHANSQIVNHLFYDSRKLELKKHVALRTSPRDTDVYELYLKTPSLAIGDTIKLVCIVAHLKAGFSDESRRYTALKIAMDYVNQHYPTENVLIMGDFNMYSSSESGYRLLTQTYPNQEICFIDPLASVGGVGSWSENSQFAAYHTQATRYHSEECFVGGGLDDRFDFILMADEINFGYKGLRYVRNSYKAVGNDGRHFNHDIDFNGNTSVPAAVLDALFDGSDHLPVTMKMAVDGKLGLYESEAAWQASIAPNPASTSAQIHFVNPSDGEVAISLYSLQGQKVASQSSSFAAGWQQTEIDLNEVPAGFYLLRIVTREGISQTLKLIVR